MAVRLRMNRKTTKASCQGILLVEVLIALLVLSVTITTSLIALRTMLDITKRSETYFEVSFVASDIVCDLFLRPRNDDIEKHPILYKNNNLDLDDAFVYSRTITDAGVDTSPEDVSNNRYAYVPVNMKIQKGDDVYYDVDYTIREETGE